MEREKIWTNPVVQIASEEHDLVVERQCPAPTGHVRSRATRNLFKARLVLQDIDQIPIPLSLVTLPRSEVTVDITDG